MANLMPKGVLGRDNFTIRKPNEWVKSGAIPTRGAESIRAGLHFGPVRHVAPAGVDYKIIGSSEGSADYSVVEGTARIGTTETTITHLIDCPPPTVVFLLNPAAVGTDGLRINCTVCGGPTDNLIEAGKFTIVNGDGYSRGDTRGYERVRVRVAVGRNTPD